MLLKNLNKVRKEQSVNKKHKARIIESDIDNKSKYYENIAIGMNMIELEKEMQSGLDLLM